MPLASIHHVKDNYIQLFKDDKELKAVLENNQKAIKHGIKVRDHNGGR